MKKAELENIILEAYEEVLKESLQDQLNEEEPEEPTPEEEPDMDTPDDTQLKDSTDTILTKFPTLKQAIIKLQTEQFKEFVQSIDWVSPRPSSFRVNLKNGQDYILKWLGDGFQAQIQGKRYFINRIDDYQQALDRLEILYRESPMKAASEGEAIDSDTGGGGGGGGGDFPGGEGGGAEDGEDFEGGDDLGGGDDGGGADLTDEPVDFQDGEEPDA